MRNAGLDEAQAGIKIAGICRYAITSDSQMTSPLWQKVKRSLLMKVKVENEKVGLKRNI